ncbi:centromere-associated protein E-like isoform X1 [Ceratina calcarata]|uniref:Centromere-associated protein E-like isoform X1 n=1 Tax=Ceratina calcarata TaxID=156304 RepID=A0AAJ7S5E9_9HYME|nr:centromere-associated protein E-like isoform X1 [Ceratina calcarata]
MANIKVAVRIRPISARFSLRRESNLTGSEVVVRTNSNEISLTNLKVSSSKAGDSRERTRKYGFDYCFDSSKPQAENFADQAKIYQTLGEPVLDAVFSGYNACLVAYGQSASGKTYTMMGTKEDPGLTPRLCEGLFARIEQQNESYRVSVSYLEIYNERVRDLLKSSSSASGLRVREHPRLGPYVQGLTQHVVRTLGTLMSYVEEGTKARKTASTLQNPSSSRSHALLTIAVATETQAVGASKKNSGRGGSKLRLVDLAGSESAATCSGVHRLKEGANINKSLVALGNVISALAERGSTGSGPGRRFIPYRDSSLTWLLKDALGGNATTIMLATISPASGSYNETAHTLRFAQRAQSVVNRPVVNEDPVARIVRELRAEVDRLKSLLLEKNISDKALLCCCQNQPTGSNQLSEVASRQSIEQDPESNNETQKTESVPKIEKERSVVPLRRSNSSDSGTAREVDTIKKFGSLEFVAGERFSYSRAKVTELNEEEDEINEIHESVFVDIPTLVAVLIKPDDDLQESSAQIEEICSDEVNEEPIEFIERVNEAFEGSEKQDSIEPDDSVNSCHTSEAEIYTRSRAKPKFRKQDSVDVLPVSLLSNLHTSKKFGSVETIQKKREPLFPLERSHTNLEKRCTIPDRVKKLNNIREIDDQISNRSWGIDQLQRKGSNDSDKSLKDQGSKSKSHARKPSLETLKRKTSKDSSSSSSKDEQILISSLARDKLLRRKSSLEGESSLKNHTPIQRAKRAEIVAAVTERLYASRKHSEDPSEMRSPPESTADIKSVTRMKLQEISRKMLGKRRRVCVDTQTECFTVRMKDTASLTETPEVILQDVGVLTDHHEFCEYSNKRTPVLRMKEISTLTDKPKTNIVRCKDAASLANDLEEFDYEIHSPRNDSGILSDDAQNYAESNLSSTEVSDLHEADRRVLYAESSTNTSMFSSCRSFAVQTPPRPEAFDRRTVSEMRSENKGCTRQCCVQQNETGNPEKSVISIRLPDTISITIESSNTLESRITVDNDDAQQKMKPLIKDEKIQTEWEEACRPTESIQSQTDSKVFRIENIFQDPNNAIKNSRVERSRARNSITFRNSLGTSYVCQAKETSEGYQDEGFIRDGLITETFINRKRGLRPSSVVYQDPLRNWQVPVSFSTKINPINYEQIVPSFRELEINENSGDSGLSLGVTGNLHGFTNTFQEDSDLKDDETDIPSASMDHDHAFSDDSLDYNEYNVDNESVIPKMKQMMDKRDNFCPPDVVAHTKKDCPKSSENDESVNCDFEDVQIEFPKKKPTEDCTQIHDYKSLILGVQKLEASYKSAEIDDTLDTSSNHAKSSDKKKVSFSNISENLSNSKRDSKPILKSIIKKRRKKLAEPVQSSNDETDDSQNEDRTGLASEDSREEPQCSSERIRDSIESIEASTDNRKKVKFSMEELEDEWSSEEDDDEIRTDVFEEYLSEAVTFMRNLNSISEYVNGRKSDRYVTSSSRARGNRRARRRSWNRDYLEYASRKVNSKEVTNHPEVDDDFVTSTESYERCLKGIQRLEDCIRRVDRHNELLKEKYGIDCESAGARLGLASPSMDPRVPISNDFESFDRTEFAKQKEDDDLEKKIFTQLMNVANSICQRNSNPRSNLSDGGSKFREKRNYVKELFDGDITGSINLETSGDDQEFETYEVTGNLSFGKTLDDFESTLEDDFLPLSRANPSSPWSDSTLDDYIRNFDSEAIDKRTTGYVVSPKRTGQASHHLQETDDQRKINGCKCSCSKDHSSVETAQLLEKLRYPGSPRAKFLELLRERRRIVECSRGGT